MKKPTETRASRIAGIVDAAREFGATVATPMIEELIDVERREASEAAWKECRAVRGAYDQRWVVFWNWAWGALALAAVAGIAFWITGIRNAAATMDAREIAACRAGDYSGCLMGYTRKGQDGAPEPDNQIAYARIYKEATGKDLVATEELMRRGLK